MLKRFFVLVCIANLLVYVWLSTKMDVQLVAIFVILVTVNH